MAAVLAKIPGITDLAVLRSLGQPTIRIDVDRVRAARYGLAPGDVNAVVQTAIGGQSAGDLYEGSSDRHFPMMVRLAAPFRQNLDAIRHIPVAASAGTGGGVIQIPLEDVANVLLVSGAAFIYREQQQRYVPIKFSVRGRDLGGAVLEAQRAVESSVLLPGGYRLEWVGEFGNLQEAVARLGVAVPLALALIVLLLYLNFSSLRDALLAASVIPMALLGGILALWVSGTPFSVSSAIGFVALFGIAAMDGILILSYYHLSLDSGLDRAGAMLHTCRTQLRPATACAPGLGGAAQRFLAERDVPRNWWTRFGSEELDDLVTEALRANPSVQAAMAALRQAEENTAAQRGSYFPAVQAEFDASRQRDPIGVLSPNLTSGVALYNLYTPQVTVSYVPDVFGAHRRQVESLAALAEASLFQLDATYLTVTANVVTTRIQESGLRAEISATERVIALEREAS